MSAAIFDPPTTVLVAQDRAIVAPFAAPEAFARPLRRFRPPHARLCRTCRTTPTTRSVLAFATRGAAARERVRVERRLGFGSVRHDVDRRGVLDGSLSSSGARRVLDCAVLRVTR